MCIDFISNQHQHEQALCTLHLFRKNPTVSRNSPDNAEVLLHNWCVGRTLLLIMRRYSFGIVFSTIPPNAGIPLIMRGTPSNYRFCNSLKSAGIPLIMRGTPSGLLVFLTAKAVGIPAVMRKFTVNLFSA